MKRWTRPPSTVFGFAFVHPYKGKFTVWQLVPQVGALPPSWHVMCVLDDAAEASQAANRYNRRMAECYPGEAPDAVLGGKGITLDANR